MAKSTRGTKEFSKEQRLVHENKRLKRELAHLRKQMARMDMDRYENVKEIIEETYQNEKTEEGANLLERLKKEWSCKECGQGFLRIMKFKRLDGVFYYRACTNCAHKTKLQKFNDTVEGIFSTPEEL